MTDTQTDSQTGTPASPDPAGNPKARKRWLTLLGIVVAIALIVWAVFHFLLAKPEE